MQFLFITQSKFINQICKDVPGISHQLSSVRCSYSDEVLDGSEPVYYNKYLKTIISKNAYDCLQKLSYDEKFKQGKGPLILKKIKPSQFKKIYFS